MSLRLAAVLTSLLLSGNMASSRPQQPPACNSTHGEACDIEEVVEMQMRSLKQSVNQHAAEGEKCKGDADCDQGLSCCWWDCYVHGEPTKDVGICVVPKATTSHGPVTTPTPDPHCIDGDACSCPVKPANRPEAGDAPQNDGWEGWATTTQFGCGDGPWGNPPNDVAIKKINDPTAPRMGAAVPWRFYFKEYGSKKNQTAMVAESIRGNIHVDACYLAQPISKYPDQISGQTDGLGEFCKSKGCTDINSAEIAAKDDKGKPYPAYLIVPFEGCGGDCKPPVPDCANTCFAAPSSAAEQIQLLSGNFSNAPSPQCDAMSVLWGNGTWEWNTEVRNEFLKYSQPLGVSQQTDYGRKVDKRSNWCSGQNMHFDIGMDTPYWVQHGMGNIAKTNANSNIIMRYKKVPCDIWGTFEADAKGDSGAGEGEKCNGDADCKTGLKCCWYDCIVHGKHTKDTGICTK
jgi:hypothetical protein